MKFIILAVYLIVILGLLGCGAVKLNDVGRCVVVKRDSDKMSTTDELISACNKEFGK